jgi:hypothetical protein
LGGGEIGGEYFGRGGGGGSYQMDFFRDFDFDFTKSGCVGVYSGDNGWKFSFAELGKEWFLLTKNGLLDGILGEDLSDKTDIKQTIIDRYERRIRRIMQ